MELSQAVKRRGRNKREEKKKKKSDSFYDAEAELE